MTTETVIDRVCNSHDDPSCKLLVSTWNGSDIQASFDEYRIDLTRAVAWALEEPYRTVKPIFVNYVDFDGQCSDEIAAAREEVQTRVAETFGLKDLEEVLV